MSETILTGAPEETAAEQTAAVPEETAGVPEQTAAEETQTKQTAEETAGVPEEKAPEYTVPENASGYEFSGKVPEGLELDAAQVEEFRKYAFEKKIPKEVFEKVIEYDLERSKKSLEAWKEQYTSCEATLKAKWGGNYAKNLAQCNKFLSSFGFAEILRGNPVLNNADFILKLSALGAKMSESKLKDGEFSAQLDPASRIAEITGDKSGAYWDEKNPGHEAAVSEVVRLTAMLTKNQNRA